MNDHISINRTRPTNHTNNTFNTTKNVSETLPSSKTSNLTITEVTAKIIHKGDPDAGNVYKSYVDFFEVNYIEIINWKNQIEEMIQVYRIMYQTNK